MASIQMLIKTSGLEYDDRLRKESLSLSEMGHDVQIVAVEYANEASHHLAYQRIPATTIGLRSRRWFKRTRGLLIKTVEMYIQFLRATIRRKPDIVWLHDLELAAFVPVLYVLKKLNLVGFVVWDQHELPPDSILRRSPIMYIFGLMINSVDSVIVANEERANLFKSLIDGQINTPIIPLYNYPDKLFLSLPRKELPDGVKAWLTTTPYLLAQGGASPGRLLDEVVEAVLGLEGIKLIIVGPYQREKIEELKGVHGDALCHNVWFTGFVPQMEMTPFIDGAVASIVLYAPNKENSRLCAPNRLFQAVARGIPVIVGANPTMADPVTKWSCGIALKSYGEDVDELRGAIECILAASSHYRNSAEKIKSTIVWETQLDSLKCVVEYAQRRTRTRIK